MTGRRHFLQLAAAAAVAPILKAGDQGACALDGSTHGEPEEPATLVESVRFPVPIRMHAGDWLYLKYQNGMLVGYVVDPAGGVR